jgi:hypothetical protein
LQPRDAVKWDSDWLWDYNIGVPLPESEKVVADRQRGARDKQYAVYASEAAGLLVIAFLLLALILVRYWQNIDWSLR